MFIDCLDNSFSCFSFVKIFVLNVLFVLIVFIILVGWEVIEILIFPGKNVYVLFLFWVMIIIFGFIVCKVCVCVDRFLLFVMI